MISIIFAVGFFEVETRSSLVLKRIYKVEIRILKSKLKQCLV